MRRIPFLLAFLLAAPALAADPDPREEIRRTEAAFAKTMADRDHAAFASFLADETVFFGRNVLRGKAAVADAWKRYFEGPTAPFSWTPERFEVLQSGELGMTSGPVFDPAGSRVGTFNSVWRRAPDGTWRIVFDIGCPECDCAPKPVEVPAGSTGITALAWMAGAWQTAPGARQVDEHWTAPAGGSMLGMSRTVANGATKEFEYLRIVEREDGVFYVAHPGGRSPGTEFRLTRSAEGEAIFENPQHDFPKRITYRRAADGTLTAIVDGGEGTKGITFAYRAVGR